jgi:hypothetical protein
VLGQTTHDGFHAVDMFVRSGILVKLELSIIDKGCMEILTDNDIGLTSLLLDKRRRVKIAEHNAHIGVCLGDGSSFSAVSHKSTDVIVWMGCLENVEYIPTNKACGASPTVKWSACH